MSEEDLRTFAESYAATSIMMSEIHCGSIGSLAKNKEGEVMWGPLLHGGYPDSLEAPFFGGPFHTLRDAYIHRIDGLIEQLKRGIIHRKSPLVHYLAFKEARRLVIGDPAFAERETTFYISHPDCSGANILSKDFKVVGLIDWEWYVGPPSSNKWVLTITGLERPRKPQLSLPRNGHTIPTLGLQGTTASPQRKSSFVKPIRIRGGPI